MSNLEALITLLGALWASYGSGMNGAKMINDIRDHIIRGEDHLGSLSVDHRRDMLYNDWVPQIISSTLLFLIFSLVIILLPALIETGSSNTMIYVVCYLGALYPVMGTIGYVWGGLADFRKMKSKLSQDDLRLNTNNWQQKKNARMTSPADISPTGIRPYFESRHEGKPALRAVDSESEDSGTERQA